MAITDKPSFSHGMDIEGFLDKFFERRGWEIKKTTTHEERKLCLGDRWFGRDDQGFYIEYKSGVQTFYTGNVFLETVSVDTNNTPGWVYTSQADYIFYATVLNGVILVFEPQILRDRIDDLKRRFREVPTRPELNDGYCTHGVIVPFEVAVTELAQKVIPLAGNDHE